MNLAPIALGLGTAKIGYNRTHNERAQEQLQQQAAQQAKEEQAKQIMLKIALEEAARRQTQANTDRTFGETSRHNQAIEALRAPTAVPKTPRWETKDTEQGLIQVNPETGETRPLTIGGKTVKPPPQKWQVYGPGNGSQEKEPNWQVVQTDEGIKQVNPKTGEVRDVVQGGQSLQKPLEASTRNKIATNKQTEQNITKALGSLVNNRQAVGLDRGRGISDAIDQRADPQGVEVRALIANIGSMVFHDRSGAAVSVSEAARLKPFIPSIRDTPEAIVQKLRSLRQAIQEETGFLSGHDHQPASATPDLHPNDNASPEQQDFMTASKRLNEQYDAAIARGVDPVKAQEVLDREMNKLRRKK